MSSANNIIWQSAYANQPAIKSLSVDLDEQYFYIAFSESPAVITKSDTTTGAISSAIKL